MSEPESSRSPELDQTRRLLFGTLSEEEGWARMDAALRGASDPQRQEAIERIAADQDLLAVLLEAVRKAAKPQPD